MLEINPDTVCHLIELAREFHAKEGVVIEEDPVSPSDDWALQILTDHKDDDVLQSFRTAMDDLEPDQQQQVVALLWLGRGDGTLDDWEVLLSDARNNWNETTADYLIAHPHLAEFLRDALEAHGYACE